MNSKIRTKYKAKAKDSFRTKSNLFLFALAIISGKDRFNVSDLKSFNIDKELVKQYTAEYWQQETSYQINGATITEIEQRINRLKEQHTDLLKEAETEYINSFPEIFSEKEFEKLLNEKKCHYCHITIDQIEQLAEKHKIYKKTLRGWTLEIDRLNSNFEYTPNNCVMACYWCNNAKTDEFTGKEFREIGKAIRKVWDERLKS